MLGILGPRKEDVPGGWRKLYGEECLNFCFLPDTTRLSIEEEMGGACGTSLAHPRDYHYVHVQ